MSLGPIRSSRSKYPFIIIIIIIIIIITIIIIIIIITIIIVYYYLADVHPRCNREAVWACTGSAKDHKIDVSFRPALHGLQLSFLFRKKMALIAAHLNAEVISGDDSVAIGIYSPWLSPTPPYPLPNILPVPNKPYGFCGR